MAAGMAISGVFVVLFTNHAGVLHKRKRKKSLSLYIENMVTGDFFSFQTFGGNRAG